MAEQDGERARLEGEDAIALWKKGGDAWNAWIDEYPGAVIDFSGVDFSTHRTEGKLLSFEGYQFGDGDVDFRDATFGDGGVTFKGVTFGGGDVNFGEAKFGAGFVSFRAAVFRDGNVSFAGANFGVGQITFTGANFGDGDVSFLGAKFGEGPILFDGATFGDGYVNFGEAKFGDKIVNFSNATFGDGNVSFERAEFRDGNVDFRGATFDCFLFHPRMLTSRWIDFSGMTIRGPSSFGFPPSRAVSSVLGLAVRTGRLKAVSFRGTIFAGPLTLVGDLSVPPDLRGTKTDHHIELAGLNVAYRRSSMCLVGPIPYQIAMHPEDAARFRRLKEIAEANRDHAAALRFAADENRAKRWKGEGWGSRFAGLLDMAFSGLSDYGQSVWRPTAGLAALTGLCAAVHALAGASEATQASAGAVGSSAGSAGGWADALLLAAAGSVAFLPQSRDVRGEAIDALYGGDPTAWLHALLLGQAGLSFVFLFLIGLGLRNRFRL